MRAQIEIYLKEEDEGISLNVCDRCVSASFRSGRVPNAHLPATLGHGACAPASATFPRFNFSNRYSLRHIFDLI